MHLLDEEERAHVGKILSTRYVRIHKPKKNARVIEILFCVLFSLLALLFLASTAYCIYCTVNGLYVLVTLPGFIIFAALAGICLREIDLCYNHDLPTWNDFGWKQSNVKSPPNFLPDPRMEANTSSHQSCTAISRNESLQNFKSEGASSIFKSTSSDVFVKYSNFEESVQFGKDPKMIRSVSQYAVDNVPNQEQLPVKSVAQSNSSSSRKRFCHNIESEEDLTEMKALPLVESSIPMGTKEIYKVSEKGSSQSLPAIKLMSNSE